MISSRFADSISGKVKRAIDEYNRYRSPESTARLVDFRGKRIRVEFKGPYCHTCGFYDYFDDYRVFLEELGLKSKIVKIREVEEGAVVDFELEDEGGAAEEA